MRGCCENQRQGQSLVNVQDVVPGDGDGDGDCETAAAPGADVGDADEDSHWPSMILFLSSTTERGTHARVLIVQRGTIMTMTNAQSRADRFQRACTCAVSSAPFRGSVSQS